MLGRVMFSSDSSCISGQLKLFSFDFMLIAAVTVLINLCSVQLTSILVRTEIRC